MDSARRRGVWAVIVVASVLVAACSPTVTPTVPRGTSAPPSAVSPRSGAPTPTARSSGSAAPMTTDAPAASASTAPGGPFDPSGAKADVAVAVSGLASPVEVTNAGDGSGRLFVLEQAGRIRVVLDGALVERPFLDIKAKVTSGGERGLLGLAFHPDYPSDPRFFVDYTDVRGDTVIASYRVSDGDPDRAEASESVLLKIDQPFANHNGGALAFGPDGMLYIAMGDGGSGGDPNGNGQRLDTLLAKILRIDVNVPAGSSASYAVPPDNPFVDIPGAKPEGWLTGLRNPWRMRFDNATGDLWIGDVGQNRFEEIDVVRAGSGGLDFGWNVMEGFHCFKPTEGCDQSGLVLPVAEYGHADGCAVIGGVVDHDREGGRLAGGYLFGDGCSDNLWVIDPAGDARREGVLVATMGKSVSSIGEAEDGSVYATSLSAGELLRIRGAGG